MAEFDAIVIGSGMSGGWAAKELCERGLKVLVLERGREVTPQKDYTDGLYPWERPQMDRVNNTEKAAHYPVQSQVYSFSETTKHFWVKDDEHPYISRGEQSGEWPGGAPGEDRRKGGFTWRRGYHLGGRSLMWGRQSYRLSPTDFEANKIDGEGVDWPIRYNDLAPWYDHVEKFVGISGARDNIPTLPDGPHFLPPFEMNCAEQDFKAKMAVNFPDRHFIMGRTANLSRPTDDQTQLGRGQCQSRNQCHQGCSFGAYFSSLSATLPAAQRTGNLTVVTDAIVSELVFDPNSQKVSAVNVIDAKTKAARRYSANIVFLNASTIGTAMILLSSQSDDMPNGLANRSDQVGRNIMDHVGGSRVSAVIPGYTDKYFWGRRPTGGYIPRYCNYPAQDQPYKRGYGFQVYSWRVGANRGARGIGQDFKVSNRTPGDWGIMLDVFGEVLPHADNRVTLHKTRTDQWGMPIPVVTAQMRSNEIAILDAAHADAHDMLTRAGYVGLHDSAKPETDMTQIGGRTHEMGTARMGRDPNTSVLDQFNRAHDVKNLFITDGAAMTSSACQNPSLTYMALSARAANYAADLFQNGDL